MPALADFHLSIQMASEGILLSLGGGVCGGGTKSISTENAFVYDR